MSACRERTSHCIIQNTMWQGRFLGKTLSFNPLHNIQRDLEPINLFLGCWAWTQSYGMLIRGTLSRSEVWKGMKWNENSIIVGTRKSWVIFPIKQKFDTTPAFFIVKMFKTRQKFEDDFLTIVHLLVSEKTDRKIVIFDQIEHFVLSKKAAVVSNFCLIGKIHHKFLVP